MYCFFPIENPTKTIKTLVLKEKKKHQTSQLIQLNIYEGISFTEVQMPRVFLGF